MEKKNNCGCDMSQVRAIVKLFTTLLSKGVLDCDCMSHSNPNRRFVEKKKRKSGGAEARKRRTAKRAETVRGASLPPVPPPPWYRAPPPSQPTEPCGRCPLVCTCMPMCMPSTSSGSERPALQVPTTRRVRVKDLPTTLTLNGVSVDVLWIKIFGQLFVFVFFEFLLQYTPISHLRFSIL